MKKLFLVMTLALAYACGGPQDGFVLEGTIQGMENGALILSDGLDGYRTIFDSVAVENGKFRCCGKVDAPQNVFVIANDQDGKLAFFNMLFLENREMKMKADASVIGGNCVFENALIDDEFRALKTMIYQSPEMKAVDSLKQASKAAAASGDTHVAGELEAQLQTARKAFLHMLMDTEGAARSFAVACFVNSFTLTMDVETREEVAAAFDSDFTGSPDLNELREGIKNEKAVSVGNIAPDFTLKDLSGKEYSLSSFRGKYVYMDFSASWCRWCKKEIPYIREAYHKYKDKDIVFITVNMDDRRELWEEDVKAENIEWLTLSNSQGFKSKMAKDYHLSTIPAIFILDKEGRIVLKNVSREALMPALDSLVR